MRCVQACDNGCAVASKVRGLCRVLSKVAELPRFCGGAAHDLEHAFTQRAGRTIGKHQALVWRPGSSRQCRQRIASIEHTADELWFFSRLEMPDWHFKFSLGRSPNAVRQLMSPGGSSTHEMGYHTLIPKK